MDVMSFTLGDHIDRRNVTENKKQSFIVKNRQIYHKYLDIIVADLLKFKSKTNYYYRLNRRKKYEKSMECSFNDHITVIIIN